MTKKALCIGINNYPGTHMDLQGCVNDAQDWGGVLQARGFAVTTLLDAQATKAAMVKAMTSLIGAAVSGDNLVITFSGHGTYQPDKDGDEVDGLDEGLCPYDLQTNGAALIDDEIRAIFAARKPGVRLLLISDSCHSGTVTRAAPAEPEADAPRPRRKRRRKLEVENVRCHKAVHLVKVGQGQDFPDLSGDISVSGIVPGIGRHINKKQSQPDGQSRNDNLFHGSLLGKFRMRSDFSCFLDIHGYHHPPIGSGICKDITENNGSISGKILTYLPFPRVLAHPDYRAAFCRLSRPQAPFQIAVLQSPPIFRKIWVQ